MEQLLRNRVVQVTVLSTLFLQIGVWVRNFAILLFVVDQTDGNPIAVSMISIAEFLPIFLFPLSVAPTRTACDQNGQ
jgi:hypothetical protein